MSKRVRSQSPEGNRGRLKQIQRRTISIYKASASATTAADTSKHIPPLRQTRYATVQIVSTPKANVVTGTKPTTPSHQTRPTTAPTVPILKANAVTDAKSRVPSHQTRSMTFSSTLKTNIIATRRASRATFKNVKHISNSVNEHSDYSENDRDSTQAIGIAVSDGNSDDDDDDDDDGDDDDDKSQGSCENIESVFESISSKAFSDKDPYQLLVKILVFTPLRETMTSSNFRQSISKDKLQAAFDDDLQNETAHLSISTKNAYKVIMTEYKNFCDNSYITRGLNRYELEGPKVVVFLEEVIFVKRTLKHIGPGTRERKLFLFRSDLEHSGVPIDGTLGIFDLQSYVNAEMTAGRGTLTSTGKRTIEVPYSVSKVEQVIACLRHLQKLQLSRKIDPNTSGLLKDCRLIDQSKENYSGSLVGGILRAELVQRNADGELIHGSRDQSTNSATINHYTVTEHIRCLLYAWRQSVNHSSVMMREHFVLAVRHSMLLRDEDLRSLNISDCSVDTFVKPPGGVQEVTTMVFTLRGGKTNQRGTPQLGMAVRHIDVRRCSIGAFAFYMFERFQVKKERWPDMNGIEWTAVKVIGSNGATRPIAYTTARDATLAVFIPQYVACSNITHSGRHSGAKEAAMLKIPEEDIRTGGRWVHGTGSMQQVYLNKQPINFALAMAGFSTKPFHLHRNEIDPPLALQRLIFPFIESAIGTPGSQENDIWMHECDQEMRQFDPNNLDDLDNIEPYAIKPTLSGSESSKSKSSILTQRSNKKHVLRLMLRLRRVLLQDAAEYLHRYSDTSLSPILNKDSLFKSLEFLAFKEEVSLCLCRDDPGVLDNLPPNLMEALQTWNRAYTSGVSATRSTLVNADQRMDAFEECFMTQAVQNSWVNDTLMSLDEKMELLQHTITQVQSLSIQQTFNAGIQQPVPTPSLQQLQYSSPATLTPRPSSHRHYNQSIRPAPVLSIAPLQPTLIPKRQKPILTLPVSFRRHPGPGRTAALAVATTRGSTDSTVISSTAMGGQEAAGSAQAQDWFVRDKSPANTRAIFEEYEWFESLRSERKKQKQSISQTGTTNKHMNNRKRIYEEVISLKNRNICDKSMGKTEALNAAFNEIDAVALPNFTKKYKIFLCLSHCLKQRNVRARAGERASTEMT